MEYIENVRAVPITDYARRIGFSLLRKGKYYSLKEHDSVIIDPLKNAFWRNSTFAKGFRGGSGGVIDFAIEFGGCSDAKEAIKEIAGMYGIEREKDYKPSYEKPYIAEATKVQRKAGEVEYPEKDTDTKKAWRYLYHERCIDNSVLKYFVAKGMLYQDVRGNCVFSTDKFACLRSTGGKKFAVDARGCDYNECFFFKGKNASDTLYVTEAVIDLLSVMSFMCIEKKRYVDYSYLALTGTNKIDSIFYHLDHEPNIKKVVLCLDNDEAGRSAVEKIKARMSVDYSHIVCVENYAPAGKDWNEYLVLTKKG